MKTIKLVLCFGYLLCLPFIYSNCSYTKPDYPKVVMGWVPIYGTSNSTSDIKMLPPQKVISPGKIFLRNQYLLLNDRNKGVHVFDNSNPENPINLGFISIPGNLDVVMKGNILYTDFYNGIVAIDLSNPTQASIISYLPSVLSMSRVKPMLNDSNQFDVYQCADSTKGVVIGWRKDSVYYDKCTGSIR